jgi:recombinational DNA repair ATPase RecF
MIRSLALENFLSFYGEHILRPKEGLNIVLGPSGSGKTNLVRALKFAILGISDIPRNRLINHRHERECLERSENPLCQVEAEIRYKSEDHLCQASLSMLGDGKIRQSWTVDSEIDEILSPEAFKHIYLDASEMLEGTREYQNDSTATRLIRSVMKHLLLNVEADIRLAILDGVFGYLHSEHRKELLGVVSRMGVEQLFVTSSCPWQLEDSLAQIHHVDFEEGLNCTSLIRPG